MKDNRFNFCPECGSKNIQTVNGGRKWVCPDCGLDLYNNVAAAVGVIILNGRGEALFERRAKEPRKGYFAIPGGFCEPDESAEDAARRECREEVGLEVTRLRFVATFPNTYEYKSVIYKTCDMFFIADVADADKINADALEVSSYEWRDVTGAEAVEKIPFAFDSSRRALLKAQEVIRES